MGDVKQNHWDWCSLDLDHDGICIAKGDDGVKEEGDSAVVDAMIHESWCTIPHDEGDCRRSPVMVQATIQSSGDREIDAAALCLRALTDLSPVAKLRVVRWLTQRVEAEI